MPEVWESKCFILTPPKAWGKSITYRVIGSSRVISPRSTSFITASAVTCFVTDPILNTMPGSTATPSSISAMP